MFILSKQVFPSVAHQSPILDVAHLKRRLIAAWSGLQPHVIDEAIDQCGVDGCAPVWKLLGDTSNICFDNTNSFVRTAVNVLDGPWCSNWTFMTRLYIWRCTVWRKIVANFYKVQYEHRNQDVAGCTYEFVSNSKNWQNWMTFDKVITNMKRVTFFFWDAVYNVY